uniref:Anion exchange protein n=1 Tax=Schistocephalus solidus TaxID=70667 RepID=A0A183SWG0_SCHSO
LKRTNMHLNACLPEGTEACCVLTGYVQELKQHVYVLTRLKTAIDGLGMVEVNNPLRFIVLFLTSDRSQVEAFSELGRCFALLMQDSAFRMTAYAAHDTNVLIQAMGNYLQTTVVLPKSAIKSAIVGETGLALPQTDPVQFDRTDLSNMWVHRYCSDFKDAFEKDNIATVLSSIPFVFFVVFGPTITMGNLYVKEVNPLVNLELCIVSCGFFTATYALLSGQPAATVGPSGPCFIFEGITAQLSRSLHVPFSNFRFWIGIYTAISGLILIGLNFSNLAKYARRSLEELFSSFVAFYFILKALFALFKVRVCMYEVQNPSTHSARYWVGAFNVPLGMLFVTVMERIIFSSYQLPTLNIPKFNEISVSSWIRIVNISTVTDFGSISAPMLHALSAVIGLFFTLLIFCETMLNSITALKPKAKKPSPVVMDHILTNVAFPLISVFLGWPFMSGVPVRTIANTMALVKLEPHPPPGKPAEIISLVEQRVNLLIVGLLVMCAVALGDILRFIPVAALYGMFLFVGMSGLRGLDLTNSISALLCRRKYWGRWEFLSNLPKQQLAVFTLIRFCELSILIAIMIIAEFSSASWISFAFPLIIIISALIREFVLPRWRWLAVYLEIVRFINLTFSATRVADLLDSLGV